MPEKDPQSDPNIGRVIADKYRIDAVVGAGGSGTVYRAAHLVLDRAVAIKVLNPALVSNPTAKARFRREARAASKLDHPFSVQVFDYGIEPDGLTYLAMELLEGRELFKVIYDDWPLSTERIVRIVSQVLSVLQAAHDAGIVHRDLKPENIMLVQRPGEDGRPTEVVKVTDFGIAKNMDVGRSEESMSLTRDGTVHGTPEYMAPEQARGEEIDGRADLYACGVILYEMLAGALPFTGDAAFDVILKQLTEPVVPPSVKRPGIDARLEPVVMRALRKQREERFPDARTMRDALLAAVAPEGGGDALRRASTLRPPAAAIGSAPASSVPDASAAPAAGAEAVPLMTRKRPSSASEPPPPSTPWGIEAARDFPAPPAERASPTPPFAPRHDRHPVLWVVLGTLVAADLALGAYVLLRAPSPAGPPTTAAADAGVAADASAPPAPADASADNADAGPARPAGPHRPPVRRVPARGRAR